MGRRLATGWCGVLLMALFMSSIGPREAYAQLGALVSPGRLSRAHASLEGITNCLSCHSAGRGVAADKCLTCHKPVAERIARQGLYLPSGLTLTETQIDQVSEAVRKVLS